MTPVESLLPEIRNHVQNCPDFMLLRALIRSARIMARESELLSQTRMLSAVAGQATYLLLPHGDQHEVTEVRSVEFAGQPLDPGLPEEMPDSAEKYCGDPTKPQKFYLRPPEVLVLGPAPRDALADGIKVEFLVQPREGATHLHDLLITKYTPEIGDGAKQWLLEMPDEKWSDLKRADYYGLRFEAGKEKARTKARNQHLVVPARLRTATHS